MGIEPPALSSASVLQSVIDYCTEGYEPQVTIARSNCSHAGSMSSSWHHQEYDDALHRTAHRSPEALEAVLRRVASFVTLAEAADRLWAGYNRAILFVPDHGAHDDESGRGTHGEDVPEDMEALHFWRLRAATA